LVAELSLKGVSFVFRFCQENSINRPVKHAARRAIWSDPLDFCYLLMLTVPAHKSNHWLRILKPFLLFCLLHYVLSLNLIIVSNHLVIVQINSFRLFKWLQIWRTRN